MNALNLWLGVSSLGSTVMTAPIAVALAVWLALAGQWRSALRWCVWFGLAMALVVASKLAFIGWGLGSSTLDFTGISGHASRAALVYPVLFYYLVLARPARAELPVVGRYSVDLGLCAGLLLALLVALSRVMVNAHSGSEMLAGWLLGSAVALLFVRSLPRPATLISPRWLLASTLVVMFVSPAVQPVQAEGPITRLALLLSGHTQPFERRLWGRDPSNMHFWPGLVPHGSEAPAPELLNKKELK